MDKRTLTTLTRFQLRTQASKIEGTGLFASEPIPARRKIGDLGGELISIREARKRARNQERICIVESHNGWALDATNDGQLRYINHSCEPNCYVRILDRRVEIYSLRKLAVEEELSLDYGETHHNGKRPCRCGAARCRGSISPASVPVPSGGH
jgi:uncharacterized protein